MNQAIIYHHPYWEATVVVPFFSLLVGIIIASVVYELIKRYTE